MSRRKLVIAGLGVALWGGWVAFAVIPEWTGARADQELVDKHRRDRVMFEATYGAGWLTRHLQEHGSLPDELPPNPSAAGDGSVKELCPTHRRQLVDCETDWAICSAENKVRALTCKPEYTIPDGGWDTPSLIPQGPRSTR